MKQDPDELLKPPEVAEILKLTERTLSDMRWKGTGPRFTKLSPGRGGRIRYRRADVQLWLAGREVGMPREVEQSVRQKQERR